jgi:hypothetical protein
MQLVHIKRSLDCMIVCVVLRVAPSCVGRIRSGSTTGGTLVATSGETELPTVSAGSLRQAGSSRTSFPARAAADEGNLIRNGADNVQDEVVDHEEGPRADHDDTQEDLQGRWIRTRSARREGSSASQRIA